MKVYNDPNSFVTDSENKYLLRISSDECKVLLEALKKFDEVGATGSPSTNSLKNAITEIDKSLNTVPIPSSSQTNGACIVCQD